jgi:phosphonate transport system ATP-binding protein
VALREEALRRLRAEERGESGRVTIAASTIPAEYLLPPLMAEFRRARPGVAFEVAVSDSRGALAALLAQECELAVVGARVPDKRLLYAPFADDEVVLVAPPPSRRGGPGRSDRALPLIARQEGSGTRAAVARLVDAEAAPIQVGSSEAAKRCVLAGLGAAFLSRRAVADELDAGRLVVVAAPGTPARRRFVVARWRSATLTAPARAFLQLMQKNR